MKSPSLHGEMVTELSPSCNLSQGERHSSLSNDLKLDFPLSKGAAVHEEFKCD